MLIGAPVVAGFLVLAGLILLDGWPRLGRLQEQHERLEELRLKAASVPGLRRELAKQEIRAQQAAQQQALLVDLIAGRDRIKTFLAEVGRVADATGVLVELYEPATPPAPKSPSSKTSSQRRSNSSKEKTSPKDPLAELGYVKTSVLLKAEGPYESLQGFLRRMESLQLLVQPSDLALKAVPFRKVAENANPDIVSKPKTELKLRLSFFDRVAGAEPQSNDPKPQRQP